MKRKIFSIFLGIFLTFFLSIGVMATLQAQENNQFFLKGSIVPPTNWTGGHSFDVLFSSDDANAGANQPKVYIDDEQNLKGYFWLGSSGWATFNHGVVDQAAKLVCPEGVLTKTVTDKTMVCPAKGSAWSENAGWIILGKEVITTGNGVYYNPNSANLEGFAWSENLGWVPMFSGKTRNDEDNTRLLVDQTEDGSYKNDEDIAAPVNFIGRVAVIGNMAGAKINKTVVNSYTRNLINNDGTYNMVQHAPLFDAIRGNIAQLTRNINPNSKPTSNGLLYINQEYCLHNDDINLCSASNDSNILQENVSKLQNGTIKTIIVKGKNVIIDADIVPSDSTDLHPKNPPAIIVLKDENGNGGDIYITKKVKKIYAYIIAEGSVFSGEKTNDNTYKKYAETGINNPFSIPQKQLYINGLLVSKNTIGLATDKTSKCPVLENKCTSDNAHEYDLSYFRSYNGGDDHSYPDTRKNLEEKIKKASVIIDYNSNVVTNPPVGLEVFR